VPDDGRDQIGQLTTGELDRYAHQLIRCLKALDTTAPIRDHVQHELITVRAEQGIRATAGDGSRRPDVTALAPGELERTRRELAASLGPDPARLTRPRTHPGPHGRH
jgi:hypothetical protein